MFDWSDYLALAEKLFRDRDGDEAILRSVISRAYYAALHSSIALLITKQKPVPTEGVHGYVWNEMKFRMGIELKPIGFSGAVLCDDRNKADYDNPFPENLPKKAEFSIKTARRIIDKTREIRSKIEEGS